MTNDDTVLARLIEWEGADEDEMRWSTASWTRPFSGIRHELTLDRWTLILWCNCEDAYLKPRGKKKCAFAFDPSGSGGCKHVRALAKMIASAIRRDPSLIDAIRRRG